MRSYFESLLDYSKVEYNGKLLLGSTHSRAMFDTFRSVRAKIVSALTLTDSPICTIEKRLSFIETIMRGFGWDTRRENWRPTKMTVATIMMIATSLTMDIRHSITMLNNRDQEEIQDIVEMFVFIVTQSVCSYRIYLVIRYRKRQRIIIKRLTEDFCRWLTTEKRTEIMRKFSRKAWFIFKVDTMILSMTTLFFVTRSLIGHTFPRPTSGIAFPYVDNMKSPFYEILYIIQITVLICQIGMALYINNIFCILAVMIGGHLECLTVDIEELEMAESDEEIDKIMDIFIKKYIKIYEVVQEINALYGTVLGLQPLYTGAVIITSTLLYDGSQTSNVFLQISFDHIIELFIYCYIGDLVLVKSFDLSQRLYFCNWIKMKESHKKTILQMIHRCQKSFTLNAGIFGPLTMEMYSKSMQMTYSMWTVFKGRAT